MASLETPPGVERPANGRAAPPTTPPRWAGEDAVPRGLAVTSAVTLRVIIVIGGVVLLGLFAKLMMVVVLPVIIAMLLATLLAPVVRGLRRRHLGAGIASFLAVLLAVLVFLGLWGLVIPPFVSQVPQVLNNAQEGAEQVANVLRPLGVSSADVQGLVKKAE